MDVKKKIIGLWGFLSLFYLLVMTFFMGSKAYAASLPSSDYYLTTGSRVEDDSTIEIKREKTLIGVTASSAALANIERISWYSSETGVISIENAPAEYGANYANLVRKGPGFSEIIAVVYFKSGGSYQLHCRAEVNLEIDYGATGILTSTISDDVILVLNKADEVDATGFEKQVILKYVNYKDGGVDVSGSAIDVKLVNWRSENNSVVTIDEDGFVTAVGAGSTNVVAITNTTSSKDEAKEIKLKVVVKPRFSLTLTEGADVGKHYSTDKPNPIPIVRGVPSNFIIESNAIPGTNLKWEVYDCSSTSTSPLPATGNKLTYAVSDAGGNLTFSNVKAGTYEIYAFADENYTKATNAPLARMKVVVPITFKNISVYMTVGDSYNFLKNTNVPSMEIFNISGIDDKVVSFNSTTGIMKAKSQGNFNMVLDYNTTAKLFDTVPVDPLNPPSATSFTVSVTVIDGISLSSSSATMYTSGTLMLQAYRSDISQPVTWSTSDAKVATVVNGLVTAGGKPGTVTISATQTVNGVEKTANCLITIKQSVATVTLNPATASLKINDYLTLHATVTPDTFTDAKLTWRSSNDSIVSITEANNLTATIQGHSGGYAVISAINQDNVVVGYCHVNVQQPVTGITLSETNLTVKLSAKTIQLRAVVAPDTAINKAVTWKSTDTTKASVNANGVVTLMKPGTVSIIATSVDSPSVTAICNLSIEIPVISVALDESSKIMFAGQTARLSYTVLPTNSTTNAVVWSSSNTSVATVDNAGKVTAKGAGTTVITLKSVDGGLVAYCNITVKRMATGMKLDTNQLDLKTGQIYTLKPIFVPADTTETLLIWETTDSKVAVVDESGKVTAMGNGKAIIMAKNESGGVVYCNVNVTQSAKGVILNYDEKTIYKGQSFRLVASVSPSGATESNVTWKVSNKSVATISANGVVKGLKAGAAIITCTTVDGGYTDACVVYVREGSAELKLNHSSYRMGLGKSVQLEIVQDKDLPSFQKVKWISNNEDVARVTKTGKVIGIRYGYATITAIAQDGSDAEATCEIRVIRPVTGLSISKSYLTLYVGGSRDLNASVRPKNATYRSAVWTSSNKKVAIVNEDGTVTGLKAGNVTITAKARDSSGKKAVCYVTVLERVPSTSITAMDKAIVLVPGESKTVQVVLNPSNSTDGLSWSSDNSGVARVDRKSGRITARSTGKAYITVMSDSGKIASVEVTVIGLNVSELTLTQYDKYQLEVEGTNGKIIWDVANPNIATIKNGLIITRAKGETTITATVNGRRLRCKLKVTKI